MIKPAIVVVGYNRPLSLRRLLESLNQAIYHYSDISLIISLDKSDKGEIISAANDFFWSHGEKIVRTFDERQGLKKHILQCGDLADRYGAVIILEDDLCMAKDFYNFTVEAVNYYKDDERIAGIGLYSHEWNGYANIPFQKRCGSVDVFAGQLSITWGQCWSSKQWNSFKRWLEDHSEYEDCDSIPEQINRWSQHSWGKFFAKYIVDARKYYIIPVISLSTNFSDAGQHSQHTNTAHQVQLWERSNIAYRFSSFDELVKYDSFFEPILDCKELLGLENKDVDIDFNQTKKKKNGKKYLLTTAALPYKIIKSFSLSLRPVELNVINHLEGEGIYLYDTESRDTKAKIRKTGWIEYNLRGYSFLQLIPYVLRNMSDVIKIKINLFLNQSKKR